MWRSVFRESLSGKVVLIAGASSGMGEQGGRMLCGMWPRKCYVNDAAIWSLDQLRVNLNAP
ncbi:hypothetical protein M569_12314 [Genlisea aurea]|uniref:Uncharacterized protein n=1 Tax=Genlisea aurea TaxID=192259 RepID=S8CDE1_9LAMI|nr:hypothetical protein M569_12314 [Genlisea aurea]